MAQSAKQSTVVILRWSTCAMIYHFYCLPILFCEKSHLNGSGSSYPCNLVLFCSETQPWSVVAPPWFRCSHSATCEKNRGRKGLPLSQKKEEPLKIRILSVFFLSSLSWRPGLPQIFFRLQTLLRTWGKTWIGKSLAIGKNLAIGKKGSQRKREWNTQEDN